MAIQIDGKRIDNKTNVQALPRISDELKRNLSDDDLRSFGILKKRCRSNRAQFSQLLQRLGATTKEIGFLISICRQGQSASPSRTSRSPQVSA
jgi:hypothetical protein